jgi:hypothetical protein
MKKPKLNLRNLPIPEKIQKSREVVIRLTGNTNYPSPNPALTVLSAAITALETAHEAAADGGKSLKSTMHAKEKILDDLMSQLGEYIANASAGDEQKILSSGLGVKTGTLHSKRIASAVAGKNPGEVICTAEAIAKGINATHEWQYCKDPIPPDAQAALLNPWIAADITTTSKVTIKNLQAGIKMWFRHRMILTKGQKEPWSVLGSVFIAP